MEQNHMLNEHPPQYQSHDPKLLNLPSVPTADPYPIHHERLLPPLPQAAPEPRYQEYPSLNPLTAYYRPGPSQLSPKSNPARSIGSPSVMDLSIDDNVRLAAEALGDLRADFVSSPAQQNRSLHISSGANPEPLLSLLTTSHPLIGTAIGGSLSAYSASKNYSPRFKSSAEYVERRFTPVVNTVGSVGRTIGVEGSVRWFLGGRRPSHHQPSELEDAQGSNKRRKVATDDSEMDRSTPYDPYAVHRHELQHRQRATSQASFADSLPAYDEYRSPSYESAQQALVPTRTDEPASPGSSWQSRLVQSTSGLSVAMSEESLRSLKYCLTWLRWANEHIGKVILALKSVLEQYDQDKANSRAIQGLGSEGQLVVRTEAERSALHAKIAELKKDVMKTLKEVVDIVSKYAGGALPENARVLVRRHLTSLPQRFKLANSRTVARNGEGGAMEVTDGANRVLVLAKEGLDMMAQVSGVLDGTIVSAEEWCERLGRNKREAREQEGREKEELQPMNAMGAEAQANGQLPHFSDVKMS